MICNDTFNQMYSKEIDVTSAEDSCHSTETFSEGDSMFSDCTIEVLLETETFTRNVAAKNFSSGKSYGKSPRAVNIRHNSDKASKTAASCKGVNKVAVGKIKNEPGKNGFYSAALPSVAENMSLHPKAVLLYNKIEISASSVIHSHMIAVAPPQPKGNESKLPYLGCRRMFYSDPVLKAAPEKALDEEVAEDMATHDNASAACGPEQAPLAASSQHTVATEPEDCACMLEDKADTEWSTEYTGRSIAERHNNPAKGEVETNLECNLFMSDFARPRNLGYPGDVPPKMRRAICRGLTSDRNQLLNKISGCSAQA
jgi:hypothetical protein